MVCNICFSSVMTLRVVRECLNGIECEGDDLQKHFGEVILHKVSHNLALVRLPLGLVILTVRKVLADLIAVSWTEVSTRFRFSFTF